MAGGRPDRLYRDGEAGFGGCGEWHIVTGGKEEVTDKKYIIWFLVIWVVQMAAAFYFCTQKQGFHEDEYYTYYSTARTNGFYVESGQWMNRETFRNEFVVLPDQRFQYGLVKLVQSWDVHPPMYYWVFHTVASFVPEVFSKWIGLSVNLFFHEINLALLAYLSFLAGGRDRRPALWAMLFYGFTPAAMSGVVFIRMYEMLTTFVLLCGILHVSAAQAGEPKSRLSVRKYLVPMALVTYMGFLTQYYYFIFLFYMAAAFCVWLLWRDRNLWNCIRYGISQGLALGLAYLTYPSCLGQMFRGQRGAQATENFFDLSNTFDRIRFFTDLLDRFVFGRGLWFLLLVVVLLGVTVYRQNRVGVRVKGTIVGNGRSAGSDDATDCSSGRVAADSLQGGSGKMADGKKEKECAGAGIGFYMLLFAVTGYFLTVSKTALLLGETSNRYQLPVYGMIVLLIFLAVREQWKRICEPFSMEKRNIQLGRSAVKTLENGLKPAAALCCLLLIVSGYLSENVVFLYPEDREQTEFATQRAEENVPVVYLYQPGEEWCIWDVTNELLAYPQVYFAAADGADGVTDERIRNAERVVVYVAKGIDWEMYRSRIFEGALKKEDCRLVFEEKYCDVYELGGL